MSGMPPRPSKSRTRDVLEVLAAGVVAVTLGTYLTVRVTENKRKIAMDALQDSGMPLLDLHIDLLTFTQVSE
jgi:hypothetical protein